MVCMANRFGVNYLVKRYDCGLCFMRLVLKGGVAHF